MTILQTAGWDDYEFLDSGEGQRFERFGKYFLVRPDPQAIWKPQQPFAEWERQAHAIYKDDAKSGHWARKQLLADKWLLTYKNLLFWAKLTPFKHTGVFPEQHLNWDFITSVIANRVKQSQKEGIATPSARNDNKPHILNLFAYTGIASLAAAAAGAKVTHLDASKQAISWVKENQLASKLTDKPIRWILDDALKFTAREIRRGVRYDGIIMDPPAYGHGPAGEVWDFAKSFPSLIDNCRQILSEKPLFVIVNAYAITASAIMLGNVLEDNLSHLAGKTTIGELALKEKKRGRLLSTGIFARWEEGK